MVRSIGRTTRLERLFRTRARLKPFLRADGDRLPLRRCEPFGARWQRFIGSGCLKIGPARSGRQRTSPQRTRGEWKSVPFPPSSRSDHSPIILDHDELTDRIAEIMGALACRSIFLSHRRNQVDDQRVDLAQIFATAFSVSICDCER
jgi:hypothetical protein